MSTPNPISEFEEAMEQYAKDIEKKTKKLALIDLENALLEAKLEGDIIPDKVFEILTLEKEKYEDRICLHCGVYSRYSYCDKCQKLADNQEEL
jgi:hypothetical protein